MSSCAVNLKLMPTYIIAFVFACATCYAERGGGFGGYHQDFGNNSYHQDYNNSYHPAYDNHYSYQDDNAVVVGVPDVYTNPTYICPVVQQCYPSGDCAPTQVCN